MEEYKQFSAKTKNEAITKACIELGATSDQLEIQVISEGSTGFFGFGSKPAIIKVRKKTETAEEKEIEKIIDSVKLDAFKEETKKEDRKPRQNPKNVKKAPKKDEEKKETVKENTKSVSKEDKEKKPVEEKNKEKADKPVKEKTVQEEKNQKEKQVKSAKQVEILKDPEEIKKTEEKAASFLRDVFASMNLGEVEINSKYNTTDGCLEVDFEGEDMGILIGKRGQTLDSLQYLTSLVVNKEKSSYIRVKLDTEDYRKRRKETLENLARGIAYKVKKTRKPVVLEPMNPYERRIIHSALQGNKFVETVSEGEEPYRHVVVKLKR